MGRSKTQQTRDTSRKSSQAPLGPMWDKKSVDEFDGRENLRDPNEADATGKWNKQPKSRPAVVVSRDNVRKV